MSVATNYVWCKNLHTTLDICRLINMQPLSAVQNNTLCHKTVCDVVLQGALNKGKRPVVKPNPTPFAKGMSVNQRFVPADVYAIFLVAILCGKGHFFKISANTQSYPLSACQTQNCFVKKMLVCFVCMRHYNKCFLCHFANPLLKTVSF